MTALYVALALAGACGFMWWLHSRRVAGADSPALDRLRAEKEQLMQEYAMLKANLEKKTEEAGELKAQLENERKESNERKGKMKNVFEATTKLEAKYESLQKENDALKKEKTKREVEANEREADMLRRITQLAQAEQSLKEERARVIRAEEDRFRLEQEERDRLWNNHENNVIAALTELCKHPSFAFSAYTNTNLPEGFDGSLKPDFMIEFLGQYVIFDAKVSKSKSLRAYVSDQVKRTVEKVKENDLIYKSIFLVVPTASLMELKEHFHIVDGYRIYIVCVEALPALLSSLKQITQYEFAEQMDPQQRENIVQLVAELDFHVNLRNAADIFLSGLGSQLLERAQKLDPALAEEVAIKKQPMNAKAAIAASEIKKLVVNLGLQKEEIQRLVSPRASVKRKDIQEIEGLFSETLQ